MQRQHPTHRKAPLHRARRALSAWSAAALLGVTVLAATGLGTGSASASGELEYPYGTQMGGRAYSIGFFDTQVLGATRPCTDLSLAIASATANCVKVSTNAQYRSSTATTSLATAKVGIPGIPAVDVKAVNATSRSSCFSQVGERGTVTIAYLKVGTKVLIAEPTKIAPNTKYVVGPVSLTLNEQQYAGNVLTVNAIHLAVDVPGVARTNAVISSASSYVSGCAWD